MTGEDLPYPLHCFVGVEGGKRGRIRQTFPCLRAVFSNKQPERDGSALEFDVAGRDVKHLVEKLEVDLPALPGPLNARTFLVGRIVPDGRRQEDGEPVVL